MEWDPSSCREKQSWEKEHLKNGELAWLLIDQRYFSEGRETKGVGGGASLDDCPRCLHYCSTSWRSWGGSNWRFIIPTQWLGRGQEAEVGKTWVLAKAEEHGLGLWGCLSPCGAQEAKRGCLRPREQRAGSLCWKHRLNTVRTTLVLCGHWTFFLSQKVLRSCSPSAQEMEITEWDR